MVWLGVDDTDSPRGGCTTWVLTEVIREVQREDPRIHLLGPPRLVRLNPNIPWRTRGNAALSARFGRGTGPHLVAGDLGGRPLRYHLRGAPLSPEQTERVWEVALRVVLESSDLDQPGTDPTVLLSERRLPEDLYWSAVREVVPWQAVRERLLELPGVRVVAFGSGQGMVGAAAALAWPARRATWEAIAYRERSRWGSPRHVDPASVRRMASRFPETFLSFDDRTRRVMIAPHTPCPILYGVRSRSRERLHSALHAVRTPDERPERWALFRTNQATGDHLVARDLGDRAEGTSGIYEGAVAEDPRPLPGGHVAFSVATGSSLSPLPCVAFEPTKALPGVVRGLLRGDLVRVWGSMPMTHRSPGPAGAGAGQGGRGAPPPERSTPLLQPPPPPTLQLEGVEVLRARPLWEKRGNPVCPGCSSRMGSIGRGKGYRCERCGRRAPPESAPGRWVSRKAREGTFLPTPSARRHLAPLEGSRKVRR